MNTHLTSTEELILQLISFEYSSKEIAQTLFISPQTVFTHRANLLAKLEVKNTAGLVRRAIELSLLKNRDYIYQHERISQPIKMSIAHQIRA